VPIVDAAGAHRFWTLGGGVGGLAAGASGMVIAGLVQIVTGHGASRVAGAALLVLAVIPAILATRCGLFIDDDSFRVVDPWGTTLLRGQVADIEAIECRRSRTRRGIPLNRVCLELDFRSDDSVTVLTVRSHVLLASSRLGGEHVSALAATETARRVIGRSQAS